ncbi:MAG: ABC transporter permease [Stellaceae bacterium]
MKLPAFLLALIAAASLAGPLVAHLIGANPAAVDLLHRFAGPSAAHPLGTDELGRDLMLRLMEGGRVSLTIGIAAALAAAMVGTAVGLTAGYLGGWTDRVLMRLADGVIALPLLPLLIVLAALDLHKIGISQGLADAPGISLVRIVVLAVLVVWTTAARLVRGATLVTKRRDFVRAAQSLGAGVPHILWRHILPNVMAPLVVATTLSVGDIILLESVLSFLGLGVQPPLTSWGSMLSNAEELTSSSPLLAVYPGAMIFLTVIACNLLGDALLQRFDPRDPARV